MSQKLPIKNKSRDLYSFGSIMPGREYTAQSVAGYRFGFNTQERDDEIFGKGNASSAQFWEYDTRLARRWNIDPLCFVYPSLSPYSTLNNSPIMVIDFNGLIGEPVRDLSTAKRISSCYLEHGTEEKIKYISVSIYSSLINAWDKSGMPDANKVREVGGSIIANNDGDIKEHRARKSVSAGSINLTSSYWFLPKGMKLIGDFHVHPYSKEEAKMFMNFDGFEMPHSQGDFNTTNRKSTRTGFVSFVYSGNNQAFVLEVTNSKAFRKEKDLFTGSIGRVFAEVEDLITEKMKNNPQMKYTEAFNSSLIEKLQKYKDGGTNFGFNLYKVKFENTQVDVEKVFDSEK